MERKKERKDTIILLHRHLRIVAYAALVADDRVVILIYVWAKNKRCMNVSIITRSSATNAA